MDEIFIDTWLYGNLAVYGGNPNERNFANVKVSLQENSTLRDLLNKLGMKTEERGITFINGDLSAMPGMQPDLNHPIKDGDRVAFFHLRSMWPFQYRHGVGMIDEMQSAIDNSEDMGLRHAYKLPEDE
jgi:molybdopterin converting factor small subunit